MGEARARGVRATTGPPARSERQPARARARAAAARGAAGSPEVEQFFASRHGAGHFGVYNLCSERAYDATRAFGAARGGAHGDGGARGRGGDGGGGVVERFPFDDHNPCALALLGAICEDACAFLARDARAVAAVHCKARAGDRATRASSRGSSRAGGDARRASGSSQPPPRARATQAGKGRTGLVACALLLACGCPARARSRRDVRRAPRAARRAPRGVCRSRLAKRWRALSARSTVFS